MVTQVAVLVLMIAPTPRGGECLLLVCHPAIHLVPFIDLGNRKSGDIFFLDTQGINSCPEIKLLLSLKSPSFKGIFFFFFLYYLVSAQASLSLRLDLTVFWL